MRVVVLISFLLILLQGGGNRIYAHSETNVSSSIVQFNQAADQLFNFSKKEDGKILIEVTDIDVEEEHLNSEEFHELADAPIFVAKPSAFENLFRFNSNHFRVHYRKNPNYFSQSTQNYSNPIYIKYSVLRI